MISKETIQQIQNRIDIVEIIGQFVKLKRRGANYIGNCPFHNEKTPSFTVSKSKQIYKCFGCGVAGNTITFLMEHEKYSYVEALRWLAKYYNIEIEETEVTPEMKMQMQTAESLHILNEFAGKFFKNYLWNEDEGKTIALSYCRERGFRDDIIEKFQIGYNPEGNNIFSKAALQQQYQAELLLKSGLSNNRNGEINDNYKGRIIFPIHNITGKIIGFGARIIGKNDKAPKYINTPENEVYIKSKIVYGLYFAKNAINQKNECLLVEGYTDVIALHQAGFENVVASGGTSLTNDQLLAIKKYTNYLTIVYDGDGAGIRAAIKGLDMAIELGFRVQLLLIPDNEDPDSYIKKYGADAFAELITNNKKDILLFQIELGLKEAQNDAYKRNDLVNRIAETISKINKTDNFTLQQDYIKRAAVLLQIDEQGMHNLVNQFIRKGIEKRQIEFNTQKEEIVETETPAQESEDIISDNQLLNPNTSIAQERYFTRNLIEYGLEQWDENSTVAEYYFKEIDENGFYELIDDKDCLNIIKIYRAWYNEGLKPNSQTFSYHEDTRIQQTVISLMQNSHELSENWTKNFEIPLPTREMLMPTEVTTGLNYLKIRKIIKLINENQKELSQAKDYQEQMILLKIHQHLKAVEKELTDNLGTVIVK